MFMQHLLTPALLNANEGGGISTFNIFLVVGVTFILLAMSKKFNGKSRKHYDDDDDDA